MATRAISLVILSALSGCAPLVLSDRGERADMPRSTTARSYYEPPLSGADYLTARKKLRHSLEESTADKSNEADDIEEVEAVNARYRIGTP